MTAREIAREYSDAATWVPIARCKPPEREQVECLFADGVVYVVTFSGSVALMDNGMRRYVDPVFWRPVQV